MGSDNLFHKKREKRELERVREIKIRNEKRRMLIVCEGETEEGYFNFIAAGISDLICDVTSDCGTSPMCVAKCATKIAQDDGGYDKVFAVFDGDIQDEKNFFDAISLCQTVNSDQLPIKAIPTTPCFEFWILLHFILSRKPYLGNKNTKSAGEHIVTDLKKQPGMQSYSKGSSLNFSAFAGRLDNAIDNAKIVEAAAIEEGERNPSTKVHHVIASMLEIDL